ncbi:MAG: site-specific integrase [Planctomycetes bacterium]|nr:site-specific integrase [Planctomycetota bacterium]
MASVHRRPLSKFWHAAWRDGSGKLHLRSTKQTDRKKALAVALEFERAERMAVDGSLTETQARRVLDDIMLRADTGERLRAPSIGDYFTKWLAATEHSKSAGTVARYAKPVRDLLTILGRHAALPLTSLSPQHFESFLAARRRDGVSSSTIQLDTKILRSALAKARRQGLIPSNPAEAVDLPKKQAVERGTFTPEEVQRLLSVASSEWKTLILIAYYTAARLGDCVDLRWNQIDLEADTVQYRQRKTGVPLTVPLHPRLGTHLRQLGGSHSSERHLMPDLAGRSTGGRHGLSEAFKRLMNKAGIDSQAVAGRGRRAVSRRSFHALRHSFTSALANVGVLPEVRMKLTGHKSEAAHQGYTHHELETLRSAVNQLPDLAD